MYKLCTQGGALSLGLLTPPTKIPPTLRPRPPEAKILLSLPWPAMGTQGFFSKGERAVPSAAGDLSCDLSNPESVNPRPGGRETRSLSRKPQPWRPLGPHLDPMQ